MLSIDPNTPKLCALRHVDISIGQDLHRRTNTIRFLDAEGLPQGPGFHVWHLDARFLQCRCLPEFMWKVTEDYEHQKKNIYRVLEPSPWTVPTNLRCPAKTKKHITTYTATTHHILTQWSFSAASVFAGSSWYERHWHVFNSFLSSMIAPYSNGYVPHQQQNQQASLPMA